MGTSIKIVLIIFLIQIGLVSFSQITTPPKPDTVKEFEIIRGPSMRSIYVDSATTLQTIAGGAVVKQGTTLFNADSMVINPTLHTAEAFNNVHINQSDTVQTYSNYLKYFGVEKNAILTGDVKLVDKNATLFTQDLDYNLGTGIGNYHNGGKVINGTTTITSNDGTYYSDTKDIYFKNNVVVDQPKNHVTTDSLLYNMLSKNYNLNGYTHIKNKEAEIFTSQGNYDNKTDNALFTSRTTVKDSSGRIYIANTMAIDNKSGNAQMEGNAIVKDSAGGYIVFANQIFLNKKSNSFLATRKPVVVFIQKNDSTYVAGDTIFSGFSTEIRKAEFLLNPDSVLHDSVQIKITNDSTKAIDTLKEKKNIQLVKKDLLVKKDTLAIKKDLLLEKDTLIKTDSVAKLNNLKKDTIPIQHDDTLKLHEKQITASKLLKPKPPPLIDSIKNIRVKTDSLVRDSIKLNITDTAKRRLDTLKNVSADSTVKPDSARYFIAFHHVKIYNDSLQSVCDSLFFSARDSIFRLYYDPIIWSGRSQITGDTIFLYTKNKKAEKLYAFDKSIIVNKTKEGFFNQIAGKTINGYFVDGKIDYMRVRGSQAESIYYAQDKDSAYLGMNRATGDVIDLYFKNDDLEKVLFVNDITGSFYPMKKIPTDQRYLKSFIWLQEKRPKNKLELFE